MGAFVAGDVVVVPFPFSDLSRSKRRPALVVAVLRGDDVVLCQITSRATSDDYSVALADADFEHGSLRQPSNVRPNRLFTADSAIVAYRAGTVHRSLLSAVREKIIQILSGE